MGVLPLSAFFFREEYVAHANDEAVKPESLSITENGSSGIGTEGEEGVERKRTTDQIKVVNDPEIREFNGYLGSSTGENVADQEHPLFLQNTDVFQNRSQPTPAIRIAEEPNHRREGPLLRSDRETNYYRVCLPTEVPGNASFLTSLKQHGKRMFSLTRWHLLLLLCWYAVLIGPLYLNWSPFRQLLFDTGVYLWDCNPIETDVSHITFIDPTTQTCAQQRLHVGNLFTLCTVADYGMSFFGGLAMDLAGPKVASVGGSLLMTFGWLLLAFSCETFRAFELGMILFGLGIDMAFYGTLPIGSLFPTHCNTVRALLVAMRSMSYMTPVLLQNVARSLRISYRGIMVGYAVVAFGPALLIAVFVTPWKPWEEGCEQVEKTENETGTETRREEEYGTHPPLPFEIHKPATPLRLIRWACFPSLVFRKTNRRVGERNDEGRTESLPSPTPFSPQNMSSKHMWEQETRESGETSTRTMVMPNGGTGPLKHPSEKEGGSWPAAIPTDTGSVSMISLSSSRKDDSEEEERGNGSYMPHPSVSSSQQQSREVTQGTSLFSTGLSILKQATDDAENVPKDVRLLNEECASQLPERTMRQIEMEVEEGMAASVEKKQDVGRMAKLRHAYTISLAFAKDYLLSSLYLPLIPYFTITLIRAVYFNAASHDLVPHALTFLHIIIGFVFLIPPLAGYIADRYGILFCMALVNTCGTLVIVLSLITLLLPAKTIWMEYVIAIIFMQNMSLMTNQIYFYVGATFPQRHLGKLIGFTCTIGGLSSLLASPMFDYSVKAGRYGFTQMLLLLAALSGVTYILLLVLHLMKKRGWKTGSEHAQTHCSAVVVSDPNVHINISSPDPHRHQMERI